jgi:hypothetical protein
VGEEHASIADLIVYQPGIGIQHFVFWSVVLDMRWRCEGKKDIERSRESSVLGVFSVNSLLRLSFRSPVLTYSPVTAQHNCMILELGMQDQGFFAVAQHLFLLSHYFAEKMASAGPSMELFIVICSTSCACVLALKPGGVLGIVYNRNSRH